jgi:hypothetical protein
MSVCTSRKSLHLASFLAWLGPAFILDSWPLKMEPRGCPETSVMNYHYTLSNSPEGPTSHVPRGRTLKNLVLFPVSTWKTHFFSFSKHVRHTLQFIFMSLIHLFINWLTLHTSYIWNPSYVRRLYYITYVTVTITELTAIPWLLPFQKYYTWFSHALY